MPAIGAITLADNDATSVTFTPVRKDVGLVVFADVSGGVQIGYPTLTATSREPNAKSRLNKAGFVFDFPALTTGADGVVRKAFSNAISILSTCHESSTLAQREQLVATVRSYVASTAFAAAVLNNDRYY